MRQRGIILFSLALLFFALQTQAKPKAFYLRVAEDRELYIEHFPAKAGKETIVLLNGLTYVASDWNSLTEDLLRRGFGVIRYDMAGMGQTLERNLAAGHFEMLQKPITFEDQVEDLNLVLKHFKIKKAQLLGLSYGGGIGIAFATRYPNKVANLVALAPYVHALENQDTWIKSQIWYTRSIYPHNPFSDEALYDYFLRMLIYSTYPIAEPTLLGGAPHYVLQRIEAVLRMVQGIREWRAERDTASLPRSKFHLVVAGQDEYVPRQNMDRFWEAVPAPARASYLNLRQAKHKMNLVTPAMVGAWTEMVVRGHSLLRKKQIFEADIYTGEVYFEGGKVNLLQPKDNPKELRNEPLQNVRSKSCRSLG